MRHSSRLITKPETRPSSRWRRARSRYAAAALVCFCFVRVCGAQEYTNAQREQAEAMLQDVNQDVKQHYFDPLALGSDWDVRVRATKEKIERADSINRALSQIAALLDSLNDSHTYFLPPPRPYRHDYGFRMEMVGDRCLVTQVRPGSDAAKKGLRPGDELLTVNGYAPTRDDIWRMHYVFWILQPQESLRLGIRMPEVGLREMKVMASFRQLPTRPDRTGSAMFEAMREMETQQDAFRPAFAAEGNTLLVIKLPELTLSELQTRALLAKMEKSPAVILDLRGDPGGSQETLRSLLGGMFEKPIEIGTLVSSRSTRTITTEVYHHSFSGKLAVLIDSQSGSAAELFARVVQLEKRGLVFGDRSAGRVMAAEQHLHHGGMSSRTGYGTIVTEAEIRMADGENLEHNGVTPDKIVLPTPSDLANGRDPVLATAADALHIAISPQAAGRLFPFQWPQE